jgi:hypothetical protein
MDNKEIVKGIVKEIVKGRVRNNHAERARVRETC